MMCVQYFYRKKTDEIKFISEEKNNFPFKSFPKRLHICQMKMTHSEPGSIVRQLANDGDLAGLTSGNTGCL